MRLILLIVLLPALASAEVLTVLKLGTNTGTGTITSSPVGVDCGGDCTEDFTTDTEVTLTASADGGSVFTGWGNATGTGTCEGISCVVTMDAAYSVTARFTAVAGTSLRGSNLNRGTDNNTTTTADDDISLSLLQDLRSYGINLFRINAEYESNISQTLRETSSMFTAHNDAMIGMLEDVILPYCRSNHVKLIYAMQDLPGGRVEQYDTDDDDENGAADGYKNSVRRVFVNQTHQDLYIDSWEALATLFVDWSDVVVGLEIMNEPQQPNVADSGYANLIKEWIDTDSTGLAYDVVAAIRVIWPGAPIIVSPTKDGVVGGVPESYTGFTPMTISNVKYVTHMYQPMTFTHQYNRAWEGVYPYPGQTPDSWGWTSESDPTTYWGYDEVLSEFDLFYDWLVANDEVGIVTEFGATRWAQGDSAFRYLRDVANILEGYGLDWSVHTYHARSYVFDIILNTVEGENDIDLDSERHQLMINWFGQNSFGRMTAGGNYGYSN